MGAGGGRGKCRMADNSDRHAAHCQPEQSTGGSALGTITLWGRSSSSNVQKVLWALAELGLAYDQREVGGKYGGLDTPAFLAMNPHGRIPVITDGELSVWESSAIIRYLAAEYGKGTLWPPSPAERSFVDRWLDWTLSTLQPGFTRLFVSYYRTPETERDPQAVASAVEACARNFATLDAHLAHRSYLAGDSFSMADIPCGPALHRYLNLGLEIDALPHVRAWYERLAGRKGYRRHVMVSFSEHYGKMLGG